MRPLTPRMVRLASFANTIEAENVVEAQRRLGVDHWRLTGLMAGLLVFGMLLVSLLARRNRLMASANRAMIALADDLGRKSDQLAAANRAVQEANADLISHNEHFHAALENMSQGLCMVDAGQRLIVCNQRFIEMFGLDGVPITPGAPLLELIGAATPVPEARRMPRAVRAEHLLLSQQHRQSSFVHEGPDGRALAVSHQPLANGGWVATYEDVTERRRTEQRVAYMAHHDVLTGLPNRALYRQRIEELLRRDQSGKPRSRCCCSTSTISRKSTTRSATAPATRCCGGGAAAARGARDADRWRAWAATSSR